MAESTALILGGNTPPESDYCDLPEAPTTPWDKLLKLKEATTRSLALQRLIATHEQNLQDLCTEKAEADFILWQLLGDNPPPLLVDLGEQVAVIKLEWHSLEIYPLVRAEDFVEGES